MSLRRWGRGLLRLTFDFFSRKRGFNAAQKLASRLFRVAPQVATVTRTVAAPRNRVIRGFQTLFRTVSARSVVRPFSMIDHNRLRFRTSRVNKRFNAYLWRLYPQDTSEIIRNLFITSLRYNPHLATYDLPNRLDDYEIGSNIACGCHAAVYELRLKDSKFSTSPARCCSGPSTSLMQSSEISNLNVKERLTIYPLALKIMFNYQFDAPEQLLWSEMGGEMIPLIRRNALPSGNMINIKALRQAHPNVIKMFTAFTDRMPILPDASLLYPDALPTADFYGLLVREPKTLFIVMKRYRMTLREYALTMKRNYWNCRVMYAQLLEAITYLYDHTISHRDMKSDNILLDFDSDDETPHLVLGDFGCALATGSWLVHYPRDSVDLGGNLALRAPEVRCARPGPGCFVDFRLADLWACGTLCYEIFTRCNPFYSKLRSNDYIESEIPELPKRVHYAVKAVTKDMLHRNPEQRPDPHVAANVVSMSLFRFGKDIRTFLDDCGFEEMFVGSRISDLGDAVSKAIKMLGEKAKRALDDVTLLYATETIMARHLCPNVVSGAELQLRATFLSRLNREDAWSALQYFYVFDDGNFTSTSCFSAEAV